jgi:hypothetical protein
VNIKWIHYPDHQVAPLGRSQGGSIKAITEWLHMGDHQQIQQAKELFDRMGENDPNEALRYLRRPRPIEISRLYPFVKAKPVIDTEPEKLLPSQWNFLLNSDIDKGDLAVIDIVMLPDKTQSSEGVLYLPRCLLLKGRAVVLLANQGYSNFRGKIIRK